MVNIQSTPIRPSTTLLETTNNFIDALRAYQKNQDSTLITKINELSQIILQQPLPTSDYVYSVGQCTTLARMKTLKCIKDNPTTKKLLNKVVQHLKPLTNIKSFNTFINTTVINDPVVSTSEKTPATTTTNTTSTTETTPVSPKGIKNQGGNDCFLIALHQFLRSPSLKKHLVERLPTSLKTVLLDDNVDSRTLRQTIAKQTVFGNLCSKLNPQGNSQLDPSEALIALFDSIGQPDANPTAVSPQSPATNANAVATTPVGPYTPPTYLSRLTGSLKRVWNAIAIFFSTIKSGFYNTYLAICYFMNPPETLDGADDLPEVATPVPIPVKKPTAPILPAVITPLHFQLKSIIEFTPDSNMPDHLKTHEEFGGINHKNCKVENHNILEFPLPPLNPDHTYSLTHLFNAFFQKETVDDKSALINGERYTAQQTKQLVFEKPPEHLILAFKRTGFDPATGASYKITQPIEEVNLHITLPDAAFETSQQTPPPQYSLKTFICHLGDGSDGGHFVSYRRDGNTWHLFNDAQSKEITEAEAEAAAQTAHVVFYEKD